MRNQLAGLLVCASLVLFFSNTPLNAEVCSSTWTSSNPNFIYSGTATWQQSIPMSCGAACARISVTLLVHNYNGAGTIDLFCSNTSSIDYGNPYYEKKMGWIGRVNIPLGSGWRTVTFPLRLPHFEWLNDNGSIYFSVQGPLQLGIEARFQVASATLQTIPWAADADGDGDIDGADLAELASNYGCNGVCEADFDGNGVVDENDLIAFSDEFAASGCPLGFYESFNDGSANNWLRTAAWSSADGVFTMNGSQPAQSIFQYAFYNNTYDNFSFEASVNQTQGEQGNAYGIHFRSSIDLTSGYQFLVASLGYYEILKTVSGNFSVLVPWTSTSGIAFDTGYNAWNRLRVSCIGSTLQFYINGHLVETLSDTSYQSGVAGVLAVDSSTILNVFNFDDVLLEEK